MKKYLIEMRAFTARHASELRKLDIEAIKALPAYSPDALATGDVKVKSCVHHEVTPAGQHIVVVQAVRDTWFGMAYASVIDGFAIEPDGARRELTVDERFRYD